MCHHVQMSWRDRWDKARAEAPAPAATVVKKSKPRKVEEAPEPTEEVSPPDVFGDVAVSAVEESSDFPQ